MKSLEVEAQIVKVRVISLSKWEFPGEFPTFKEGTPVVLTGGEDDDFAGWYPCEIEGLSTFVPQTFLRDGKLTRDYNPTELIVREGDELEVLEIVNAWLIAKNSKGIIGWIAAECVVGKK